MFSDNVTKKLLAIQNEQKAQKVASTLNYGQLVKPLNTPTQTWSGNVQNLVDFDSGVNARWIATFTRTDGIDQPPYVMFPYDYVLARYSYDDLIESGSVTSVSGRDKRAIDEFNFFDELAEIGSNYVKWKIEVDNQFYYNASNGTNVTITAQAVSMVPGTLTLQRVV
jgi:hypothetical protein